MVADGVSKMKKGFMSIKVQLSMCITNVKCLMIEIISKTQKEELDPDVA